MKRRSHGTQRKNQSNLACELAASRFYDCPFTWERSFSLRTRIRSTPSMENNATTTKFRATRTCRVEIAFADVILPALRARAHAYRCGFISDINKRRPLRADIGSEITNYLSARNDRFRQLVGNLAGARAKCYIQRPIYVPVSAFLSLPKPYKSIAREFAFFPFSPVRRTRTCNNFSYTG